MNPQVRIPVPVPGNTSTRSTADAFELATTRERAAAYAREQEAHGREVVDAAEMYGAATFAEDRRARAIYARARTETRAGMTRFATGAAVGAAAALMAMPLGVVASTAAVLGVFGVVRLWQGDGGQ